MRLQSQEQTAPPGSRTAGRWNQADPDTNQRKVVRVTRLGCTALTANYRGGRRFENVPWKLGAIHAGDWLATLLIISIIVALWR